MSSNAEKRTVSLFHEVQTWRAIRAMCSDSSLKEGHVNNHASNYLAVDNHSLRLYSQSDSRIHDRLRVNLYKRAIVVGSFLL